MTRFLRAAAVALLLAAPLSAAGRQEFTKEFSRTMPLAAPQKLRIENSNGDVRVKTRAGGDVTIHASIRVSSSDQEGAEKFAADIRIEVEQGGSGVSVRTIYPHKDWSFRGSGYVSYAVDYEIAIPDGVPLELRNRFGNVSIENLHADGDVRNSNGQVQFRGGRGVQHLENSFGRLAVAGNAGDVSVVNGNGDTSVADVDGRSDIQSRFGRIDVARLRKPAKIVNSNGDVVLRDVAGGSTVTTSFGRIDADTVAGSIELHDSNGAVSVRKIQGSARIETRFGAAEATGVGGNLSVENANGPITVTDLGGAADLRGSFGAIHATRIGGDAAVTATNSAVALADVRGNVRVRTSFAPVSLERFGGAVDVDNQNGSIEARAPDAVNCSRTALRTTFGTIRFVLPPNPDYRVEARTTFGRIHSDVPVAGASQDAGSGEGALSGSIGRGRCPLTLTDSNGSIEIVKGR